MHWNLLMWGGIATSVPLIIHLLNRRRFRVVRWAAMEFVLKAVKQNKKRIRLENFLLLLLRMLLIFLIALFVARTQSGGGVLSVLPGASESIERIFIIDDSASLDQKFGGKTAYEQAVEASIEFCDDLIDKESSDVVTLVIGSKPAIAKRRLAPKVAKDELKLLLKRKAVDIPIDLVSAVKTVVDGKDAEESGEDAKTESLRKVLYVMTDMREVDWIGPSQSKAKRLGAQLRQFQDQGDKKAEILLIDVASDDVGNVGITDFKCLDKVILSKIDAKFQATIKNFGLKELNNLQLMLKVGNSSVPSKSIKSLKRGQSLEINFSHRFSKPGVTPVTIKVVGGDGDKDVLSRDDQRHLSVEVLESINLLVVDGESARGDEVEESYFISSALAPTDRFSVSCKVIDSDDILDEDLNQFHAIVICNLDYWPEQRLLALKNFIKRGGGLGIYLGDRINPRRYMADFWDRGNGFLPAPIGELKGSDDPDVVFQLAPLTQPHTVVSAFEGKGQMLMRLIHFQKCYDIPDFDYGSLGEKRKLSRPNVLLRFADDKKTPALIERTYGKGRVLLFNTSADTEWTDWPKDYSYVLVAQQTARYLAPTSSAQRNLLAGQALKRGVNPAYYKNDAKLFPPEALKLPARTLFFRRKNPAALYQRLSYEETSMAGIYKLVLKKTVSGGGAGKDVAESFAINLAAEESDLRRIEKTQLMSAMPGVKLQVSRLLDKNLLTLTQGENKDLWKFFLFTFLALLIAEGAFSQYLGRHSAAPIED